MCARECLAGEKCDRKAACEVADSTYGPRIRFRQIQLAEDQLLGLQMECRDCPDKSIYGLSGCRWCVVPGKMRRLERKLVRLRAQAVGREERKPTRDRRQAKPNAVYMRGMAR